MKKILAIFMLLFTSFAFAGDLDNVILKDNKGQIKTFSEFKGKTYVKLWASWCPVCLATMDHTLELSKEKNLGFNVVSITSPNKNGELSEKDFINWYKGTDWTKLNTYMDNQGEIIKKVRLRAYPTNLFIDSKGNISKIHAGALTNKQIKEIMSKIK